MKSSTTAEFWECYSRLPPHIKRLARRTYKTWAHIKRGNAYDAKGDRPKAVYEYNKALQAGSNYDNAQTVAKKFINIPFDPKAAAEQAQNAPGDF